MNVTILAPGIEPQLIGKCFGNQEENGAEGCSSWIVSRRDGDRRSDRGYFCDAPPIFADLKGGKTLRPVGMLQGIVKSNLAGLIVRLLDSSGENNLAHCQDLVHVPAASAEDRCRCGHSSAGDLLGASACCSPLRRICHRVRDCLAYDSHVVRIQESCDSP